MFPFLIGLKQDSCLRVQQLDVIDKREATLNPGALYTISALREWTRHHFAALSWAAFNAFPLGSHPERVKTHFICFRLRKRATQSSKSKHLWTVESAALMRQNERLDVLMNIRGAQEEYRTRDRQDRLSSFYALDYDAEAPYSTWQMMWEADELENMTESNDWENIVRDMTSGHPKYKIVGGNPVLIDVSKVSEPQLRCMTIFMNSQDAEV